MKLQNIKVNYLTDPLGIDCAVPPVFSWEYSDEFNLKQLGYRILVSESETELESGTGEVWDSGFVESDVSCGIEFNGVSLKKQTEYFFKVFTKTNKGDLESGICKFETALVQKDWDGVLWIVSSLNTSHSSSYVRVNFRLQGKPIKKARAYVAVLGLFEFYINGKKTDDYFMNPIISDNNIRLKYLTYDITPYLTQTSNALGIFLSQGWTDLKRSRYIIDVFYEDGTSERLTSSTQTHWEVGGPVVSSTLYEGEVYDANIAETYKKWATTDYTINGRKCFMDWGVCQRVEDRLNLKMQPQQLPGIKVVERLEPVSKTVLTDGRVVYSFGRYLSGWVKIKVKGSKNSSVTMQFAEQVNDDGSLNLTTLRYARCRDKYILCGNGEEEYSPRFSYRAFIYVEIATEGDAEVLSVVAEYIKTDVDPIGSFNCSNPILNRLHKMIYDTEGSNQNSMLTDCNQRNERFGWLNDLCSRIYQVINNYDMSVFLEKIIEDITDTQDETGAIADTAPNYFVGKRPAEPAAVCYLLAGRFLYELYGNERVIKKYFANFKKVVDFYYGLTENGILYFTVYGDWVPSYPNNDADIRRNIYSQTGAFSTQIMFWYLDEIVKLAKIIGDEQAVKEYSEKRNYIREKLNEKFFDYEKGYYGSGTQTENAFPLVLGTCPDGREKDVYNAMVKNVKNLGNHFSCGNLAYRALFDALIRNGDCELAEKVLTNPEYPGWGFMAAQGSFSVWERWEKDVTHLVMHSLGHPMFGSYDICFYQGLAGIRTQENCRGMSEFTLSPAFNEDISFVECSIKTVKGTVQSNWHRDGDRIVYEFSVPSNTTANLMVDGEILSLPDGITKTENGYKCVSGKYRIILKKEK